MEKVLIEFREGSYRSQIASFEAAADLIQEVVTFYLASGLPPLTTNCLYRLFKEPEALLLDKMTDGQPIVVGNVQLCRKRLSSYYKSQKGMTSY
ncbi:hypothetical protein [Paraflavitalea speifideaquila]|uniref:hypothetical protein n=1 Tax=Paraflavitalea speifideaquila TaxID=3076558 RepID=UPI0028E6EE75|nr:hypothetical protein [Paraflavitalea speifideiaquila]